MSQDTANEPGNERPERTSGGPTSRACSRTTADDFRTRAPRELNLSALLDDNAAAFGRAHKVPALLYAGSVQWLLNRLSSTGNGGCLSVLQDIRSGKRRGYGCPGQETRGCKGSQSH